MKKSTGYRWSKIAENMEEFNFPDNNLTEIQVNDKIFCVGFSKEQLYACAARCPHAGGNLVNGYIDAAVNIVCPLHHYKFNLRNGRNVVSGEGYNLKTYAVEQREDGIYMRME